MRLYPGSGNEAENVCEAPSLQTRERTAVHAPIFMLVIVMSITATVMLYCEFAHAVFSQAAIHDRHSGGVLPSLLHATLDESLR